MTTPDAIISQIDSANISLDANKPDLSGIKAKYDGDPEKMAEAIHNLNKQNTQLSQSISVPSDYKLFDDHKKHLDTDTVTKLINHAREAKFTQEQFDSWVQRYIIKAAELKEKAITADKNRRAILGSDDEVDKLRVHFKNRLPEQVLEKILKDGDEDSIKALQFKRAQDLNLDFNNLSKTGDSPVINVDDYKKNRTDKMAEIQATYLKTKDRNTTAEMRKEYDEKLASLSRDVAKLDQDQQMSQVAQQLKSYM